MKRELLKKDNIVVISRNAPTTKFCPVCARINPIKLSEIVYHCECGLLKEDRDAHAAKNILWFYENNVGVGHTKFKRGEIREAIDKAHGKLDCRESLKREAVTF